MAAAGRPPLSHLAGLGLLALLTPAAPASSSLSLAVATIFAPVVTAAWETTSLRRR